MAKEDEISRNLTLIEYYKEQLGSLEIQQQYLQAALQDIYKSKVTMEQMENADKDTEILIPIGGGVYINGSLNNVTKVLLDVGAGVVTEKGIPDAIKKLEEKIKNIQENFEKLLQMAQKIQEESAKLSQETQQLIDASKQQL